MGRFMWDWGWPEYAVALVGLVVFAGLAFWVTRSIRRE
jgi:hypothetical protein